MSKLPYHVKNLLHEFNKMSDIDQKVFLDNINTSEEPPKENPEKDYFRGKHYESYVVNKILPTADDLVKLGISDFAESYGIDFNDYTWLGSEDWVILQIKIEGTVYSMVQWFPRTRAVGYAWKSDKLENVTRYPFSDFSCDIEYMNYLCENGGLLTPFFEWYRIASRTWESHIWYHTLDDNSENFIH